MIQKAVCPNCEDYEGYPIKLEDGVCPVCGYAIF